jgi:hypothetical protein
MACGSCGRGRPAIKVVYEVTYQNGSAKQEFGTKLEADAAVRRAGGGTIRPKQKV